MHVRIWIAAVAATALIIGFSPSSVAQEPAPSPPTTPAPQPSPAPQPVPSPTPMPPRPAPWDHSEKLSPKADKDMDGLLEQYKKLMDVYCVLLKAKACGSKEDIDKAEAAYNTAYTAFDAAVTSFVDSYDDGLSHMSPKDADYSRSRAKKKVIQQLRKEAHTPDCDTNCGGKGIKGSSTLPLQPQDSGINLGIGLGVDGGHDRNHWGHDDKYHDDKSKPDDKIKDKDTDKDKGDDKPY